MASGWSRGGSLPSSSQNHTILPGVAELLSATKSPDSVPTYRTADSSRPVPAAPPSPPNPPPVAYSFVNPASSAAASPGTRWPVYSNHARSGSRLNKPMPINRVQGALTPDSNQVHLSDQRPGPNYTSPYRPDADSARPHNSASSPGSQSLHSTVRSQSPMNSHRQDSAVSHQRYDVSKEAQSSFPPSDVTSTSLRQSPIDSHQSHSPRPMYNPLTPSSPFQSTSPATHALKPIQPKSTLGEDQNLTASSASQDPTAAGPNAPRTDFESDLQPSSRTDIASGRQRYNVRFIANYTSENMPPAPKGRPDISALPPSPDGHDIDPPRHDKPLSPLGDLSPKTNASEEHLPLPEKYSIYSMHQCKYCGDRWERPLPGTNLYGQNKPIENGSDFGRSNMHFVENLQAHGRYADALHEKWLRKHWQCELRATDSLARPPSPVRHSSTHSAHASSSNGVASSGGLSMKRKLEEPPNDENQHATSKYRRVGPEPYFVSPAPTRPSTSP